MEQLNASEAARILASQRRLKSVVCDRCGKEFITKGRGRYCRLACKQAAYRNRKKTAINGGGSK